MSLAGYYHWFHREWMRAGLVVAAFLLVYLTVLVAPTDLALYAMLLCAPLYMLHETEEYLFPGGFVEFANRDIYKQNPETGMLDEALVYWINMGYIWLPLPICGLLAVYDLALLRLVWARSPIPLVYAAGTAHPLSLNGEAGRWVSLPATR
jgi:hypothetical protein